MLPVFRHLLELIFRFIQNVNCFLLAAQGSPPLSLTSSKRPRARHHSGHSVSLLSWNIEGPFQLLPSEVFMSKIFSSILIFKLCFSCPVSIFFIGGSSYTHTGQPHVPLVSVVSVPQAANPPSRPALCGSLPPQRLCSSSRGFPFHIHWRGGFSFTSHFSP